MILEHNGLLEFIFIMPHIFSLSSHAFKQIYYDVFLLIIRVCYPFSLDEIHSFHVISQQI